MGHPKNLMHHGNKGKQQRDRRKLRESPLATVSLSGSCEGRTSPVHQPAGHELPQPVERRNSGRLGSQPHHPQYTSAYSRPRLRDKSPRSEDLEADDEQGDKTDNDHDSSVTTVREQPPQATTASLQPAEQ